MFFFIRILFRLRFFPPDIETHGQFGLLSEIVPDNEPYFGVFVRQAAIPQGKHLPHRIAPVDPGHIVQRMELSVYQQRPLVVRHFAFAFHLDVPDVILRIVEIPLLCQRQADLHVFPLGDFFGQMPGGQPEGISLLHVDFIVAGPKCQRGQQDRTVTV